jgi:hypothetical protein
LDAARASALGRGDPNDIDSVIPGSGPPDSVSLPLHLTPGERLVVLPSDKVGMVPDLVRCAPHRGRQIRWRQANGPPPLTMINHIAAPPDSNLGRSSPQVLAALARDVAAVLATRR